MFGKLVTWLGQKAGDETGGKLNDFGLLLLRLIIGSMMLLSHGGDKLVGFVDMAATFPDPLGVGSTASLAMTVFAEFFCSLAIIFGLLTRAAVIPLFITMLVAIFVIHGDDPWGKKEFAVLYLVPYLTLFFTGAGRYSLDNKLFSKRW